MRKKDFLNNLARILEKKKINEKDSLKNLEFDSLNVLDLATFNDANFKNLNIPYGALQKCKTIEDLIKLYGNKIK